MKQFLSKNEWLEGLASGIGIIALMVGYVLFGLLYDSLVGKVEGFLYPNADAQSQKQTEPCTPMLDKFGKFMGCQ